MPRERRRSRRLSVRGAIAACLFLSACAGGSGTPRPAPTVCPEFAVPAPPTLMYPQNGASGVADGNFTLVAGVYNGTPPAPVLVPSNGGASVTAGSPQPPPSPLPSPASTPQPSQTVYGFAVGALAPSTAYAVTFTYGPIIPGCTTPETSGSFTTR